jgi:hypothetical protein
MFKKLMTSGLYLAMLVNAGAEVIDLKLIDNAVTSELNRQINVGTIEAFPVDQALFLSDDTALTYISSPELYNNEDVLARGIQSVEITLSKDAEFGVNVQGITLAPGEAKSFKLKVVDGKLHIPIYPSESGVLGSASFVINLPFVESIWCESEFEVEREIEQCVSITTFEEGWNCSSNKYSLNKYERSCTWVRTVSSLGSCPYGSKASGGSKCSIINYGKSPTPNCQNGATLVNGKCSSTQTKAINTECVGFTFQLYKMAPYEDMCTRTVSKSCKNGYMKTRDGTQCQQSGSLNHNNGDGVCSSSFYPYYTPNPGGQAYCSRIPGPYKSNVEPYMYCPTNTHKVAGYKQCFLTPQPPPPCPDSDYSLNANTGLCTGTFSSNPTYQCKVGYSLGHGGCYKYRYVNRPVAGCSNGYEDIGRSQCRKTFIVDASPVCPENSNFDVEKDLCVEKTIKPYIVID